MVPSRLAELPARDRTLVRANGLTPQRHLLLLLMIKETPTGASSKADARVAHLRLTSEGERRLASVFTHLDVECEQLRTAFGELDVAGVSPPGGG
jgi:hypothetical protein